MGCLQCDRISFLLTLYGLRLKRLGKFVDRNAEARTMRALYFQSNYERIRKRLNF